jgi:hypothetical protein
VGTEDDDDGAKIPMGVMQGANIMIEGYSQVATPNSERYVI